MAKYGEEKELGFKHHVQEFSDLSEEIRYISNIGRVARLNVGQLVSYYEFIRHLNRIYSPYLRRPKEIYSILEKIEPKVYDKTYFEKLDRLSKTPRADIRNEIDKYENKVLNLLDKIFTEMSSDFVDCELRPKPTIKPKKFSETLEDETERIFHEALEEIGM
jgi:hypothetical protein